MLCKHARDGLGGPAMAATRFVTFLLAAFVLLGLSPARSQPDSGEVARDLIHSDVPLFRAGENTWPQAFFEEDSSGCASRVAFGDWALREADAEDDGVEWYRVLNYGVFHCFAVVARARQREELEFSEHSPSFFVLLGTVQIEDNVTELWALQMGVRPGSDYMLLSRPQGEGAIDRFSVLQAQCPRANVRDPGTLSILLTRYCAINTRADLLRLARRMAQRPPRATLSFVEPPDEGAGVGR
jgi:hypothetical protein